MFVLDMAYIANIVCKPEQRPAFTVRDPAMELIRWRDFIASKSLGWQTFGISQLNLAFSQFKKKL